MALFDNVDFSAAVDNFADVGGFDVVLPFILVFAVTFAVLRKIKLFGENKNVDAIVSLILAAFLVSATDLVEILIGFLPRVSMIVLVLLMLILVVGIFSGGSSWGGGWLLAGAVVAIFSVLWALGAAAEWEVPLLEEVTEQDIGTLIVIGVFVLVIWLIVREPGNGGGRSLGDRFESLVKGLTGGGKGK